MSETIETPDAGAAIDRLFESGMRWRKRAEQLETALMLLVSDVEQYEAWQRPCYALDIARAALAKAAPFPPQKQNEGDA